MKTDPRQPGNPVSSEKEKRDRMVDVDYSIVVPAFNEEDFLPGCLEALSGAMEAAESCTGELVVVDNNSTDATAEIAGGYGARVVFEEINQISRARNRGAEAARGRFLIFTDADTIVSPELLKSALTGLREDSLCGGGCVVGTADAMSPPMTMLLGLWNFVSRTFRVAAGSFIFCRREAWEEVGGFNQELYASEEIHFSRALKRWGRERNMYFRILPEENLTSMRKIEWYTPWRLLWLFFRVVLCPGLLKTRSGCRLWYDRPHRGTDENRPNP